MFFYEFPISKRLFSKPAIKKLGHGDKLKRQKALIMTCVPILISNLVYSLIVFLPRYYIEDIYGESLLGIFASISAPALVIPMLASYIYTPLMPMLTKHHVENNKQSLTKLIVKIGSVILGIALIVLCAGQLLGEWGLVVLFGSAIKPHVYLLIPIIISVVCTAFVFFLNSVIISMRKFRLLIISSVMTAILSIVLSKSFVNHSLNGASVAIIIVQSMQIAVVLTGLIIDLKIRKQAPDRKELEG
jgi:O-antigen/teichoic acid export membrane protein